MTSKRNHSSVSHNLLQFFGGYVARIYLIGRTRKQLSRRDQLLIVEIGKDRIDSASSFVEYISESYGFSRSSIWYIMNKLKEQKVIEFASRDEPGKPLMLTKDGLREYEAIDEMSKKNIMSSFESFDVINSNRQSNTYRIGIGAQMR